MQDMHTTVLLGGRAARFLWLQLEQHGQQPKTSPLELDRLRRIPAAQETGFFSKPKSGNINNGSSALRSETEATARRKARSQLEKICIPWAWELFAHDAWSLPSSALQQHRHSPRPAPSTPLLLPSYSIFFVSLLSFTCFPAAFSACAGRGRLPWSCITISRRRPMKPDPHLGFRG